MTEPGDNKDSQTKTDVEVPGQPAEPIQFFRLIHSQPCEESAGKIAKSPSSKHTHWHFQLHPCNSGLPHLYKHARNSRLYILLLQHTEHVLVLGDGTWQQYQQIRICPFKKHILPTPSRELLFQLAASCIRKGNRYHHRRYSSRRAELENPVRPGKELFCEVFPPLCPTSLSQQHTGEQRLSLKPGMLTGHEHFSRALLCAM